jgi:hypothetical protein
MSSFSSVTERAFLADFANGVEPAKARELFAVQQPCAAALTKTAKTTVAGPLHVRDLVSAWVDVFERARDATERSPGTDPRSQNRILTTLQNAIHFSLVPRVASTRPVSTR